MTTPSLSPSMAWKNPLGGKGGILGQGNILGGIWSFLGSIWGEKGEILRGRALKLVIFGNSWNDLMGFGGNEGSSVF